MKETGIDRSAERIKNNSEFLYTTADIIVVLYII